MARALGLAEPELIPSVARSAPHVEVVRRSRRAEAEVVVVGRHGRGSVHDPVVLATRLAEPGAELLLVHACQPPALARLVSAGSPARDRAADRLFDARNAAGNMKALVGGAGGGVGPRPRAARPPADDGSLRGRPGGR